MSTIGVLQEVGNERLAQDEKWGPIQTLPDGTGADLYMPASSITGDFTYRELREQFTTVNDYGEATWSTVLMEELFEALSETDRVKLRAELIQTAAVAVKWVEAIDRETA